MTGADTKSASVPNGVLALADDYGRAVAAFPVAAAG